MWFLSILCFLFFIIQTSKGRLEAIKAIKYGQEYEAVGMLYTAGEDVKCFNNLGI